MSFYKQSRSLPGRFRLVLASFLQRPGLPFADALPDDAIQKAFDDEDASFAHASKTNCVPVSCPRFLPPPFLAFAVSCRFLRLPEHSWRHRVLWNGLGLGSSDRGRCARELG